MIRSLDDVSRIAGEKGPKKLAMGVVVADRLEKEVR